MRDLEALMHHDSGVIDPFSPRCLVPEVQTVLAKAKYNYNIPAVRQDIPYKMILELSSGIHEMGRQSLGGRHPVAVSNRRIFARTT